MLTMLVTFAACSTNGGKADGGGIESDSGGRVTPSQDAANDVVVADATSMPPPVLDRLQVDLATAFMADVGKVDDMLLAQGPVVASGDVPAGHNGVAEPSLLLQFLNRDAKVTAGLSGTVVFIKDQTAETCDSEINIVPDGNDLKNPAWVVSYDHVKSPTVKVGDKIAVGDILGTPGSVFNSCDGPGRVELQINDQKTGLAHCPLTFLTTSAQTSSKTSLKVLMESWNKTAGKTIYDQAHVDGAGCMAETTKP